MTGLPHTPSPLLPTPSSHTSPAPRMSPRHQARSRMQRLQPAALQGPDRLPRSLDWEGGETTRCRTQGPAAPGRPSPSRRRSSLKTGARQALRRAAPRRTPSPSPAGRWAPSARLRAHRQAPLPPERREGPGGAMRSEGDPRARRPVTRDQPPRPRPPGRQPGARKRAPAHLLRAGLSGTRGSQPPRAGPA